MITGKITLYKETNFIQETIHHLFPTDYGYEYDDIRYPNHERTVPPVEERLSVLFALAFKTAPDLGFEIGKKVKRSNSDKEGIIVDISVDPICSFNEYFQEYEPLVIAFDYNGTINSYHFSLSDVELID